MGLAKERCLPLILNDIPSKELIDKLKAGATEPVVGDADWKINGAFIVDSIYYGNLSTEQKDKYATSTHFMGVGLPG